MKKLIFIFLLLLPFMASAQADIPDDVIFKAEVTNIIAEEKTTLPDGTVSVQQHLGLKGLDGEYKDKEIEFNGIGEIDVLNKHIYKQGDKVLVAASFGLEGRAYYYVVDYVRTGKIWLLVALFIITLIFVGRLKGIKSLLALILSFIVITKFIIPRILAGSSPLIITIIGSIFIILLIIYITEGWRPRAHLAVISIFFSLVLTILLSDFFVYITKLTGAASEEVLFLFNIEGTSINLTGLLLAGIIIGALGVLDDVVISQVAATEEIAKAGNNLSKKEIYKKSYSVGVSHIASMTNTLFLAYAGASLPLLVLFVSGESAFNNIWQAVNTELIATEIVRTLSGSIGLILSVPIATLIASWWFGKKN